MVEAVKYSATGRRKCSVARVNLVPGTGKVIINKKAIEVYFPRESDRTAILTPLTVSSLLNKFDLIAQVSGGGLTGQAGAIRLGVSRALVLCDQTHKPSLRKLDLLRRDPRMKERKKPGQKGARKKFQWVKR